MTATIADIAAATRDVALATWSDSTIAARYPSARDGTLSPAAGFCDDIANAQILIDARGALIGVERRRFAAVMSALIWPDLSAGIPQARLIDAEQVADLSTLAARIEVDLEAETTTHELFG